MKSLNVGIDASGLLSGKPATGLERYLASLVTHLAACSPSANLTLYLYFVHPVPPQSCAPGRPLSKLLPGQHVHWRVAPLARGWHRLGMGLAMHLDRLDVFHFPAPRMARYCPVPSVVTIHDLAALSVETEQAQKERRYMPDALDAGRRATGLIAVSRSAADEIARHLHRTDAVLIPEAVDLSQFHPASASEVRQIQTTYGLQRYVLCVGTIQARKNHLRLIQAFEQIQDRIPHTLVIAGRDGSGANAVRSYLENHPNPRVCVLGYVEDSLLPALYSGADALALPSLWEGFGLPLLEAMACNTLVLTSRVSGLAEVADGAAVLVDPRNTEEIADSLYHLLTDSDQRARLVERGRERARSYSWEQAAEQTIAVYRQVAGRAGG